MGLLKSSGCSLAARLALAGAATLGGILFVRHCRQRLLRSKLWILGCNSNPIAVLSKSSESALGAFSGAFTDDLSATPAAPAVNVGASLQFSSPPSVSLSPAVECLSACTNKHVVDEASTDPAQVPPLPTTPVPPIDDADYAVPAGADDDCHPEGRNDSDSDSDRDEAPSPPGRQSLASYLSRHGLDRCEFIKVLGQGAQGRCELVSVPPPHGSQDPILAVRKVLIKGKGDVSRSEALDREVAGTLAAKGCDSAVQLLASTRPKTDDDDHMLLLSYVPGGSLCEYLDLLIELQERQPQPQSSRKKGKGGKASASRTLLPEPLIKNLARSVLTAVSFMHNNNMAHLDISSDNVFIDDSACEMRFVLGDMGMAGCVDEAGFVRGTVAGKYNFAAPEVYTQLVGNVAEGGVSVKADMVSVGMLLAESAAFRSNPSRMRSYLRGECDLPPRTPPALKDLIEWLVNSSPEARPSATEALAHPYLQA